MSFWRYEQYSWDPSNKKCLLQVHHNPFAKGIRHQQQQNNIPFDPLPPASRKRSLSSSVSTSPSTSSATPSDTPPCKASPAFPLLPFSSFPTPPDTHHPYFPPYPVGHPIYPSFPFDYGMHMWAQQPLFLPQNQIIEDNKENIVRL